MLRDIEWITPLSRKRLDNFKTRLAELSIVNWLNHLTSLLVSLKKPMVFRATEIQVKIIPLLTKVNEWMNE